MINKIVIAILLSLSLTNCGGGGSTPPPPTTYDAFGAPELVEIVGYSGVLAEDNVMEPFFSRDEQYLFFNDNAPGGKNLHYATYDGTDFNYSGEIGPGINDASSVQGVPTMDSSDIFYFVDTKFYDPTGSPPVYVTLFSGTWTGTSITGVTPVTSSPLPALPVTIPTAGFLNFDLEISADGNTLWFNDGFFSINPFPDAADIKYATFVSPGIFDRAPDADTIMTNINTSEDLEYAPAISTDGLEMFFTRLDLDTMDARIYRAIRPDTNSAFGTPLLVSAIPGFSEGATFSQDEKTIYYHWFNPGINKFELYRVTRP